LPQLDFLRAVANLLVLGGHPAIKANDAGPFLPLAYVWHLIGWTGVDLFFVLSGFLIGGLLFAEIRATGSLQVRRFLIRRAFKIWPAYYVYLLVQLAILSVKQLPLTLIVPFLLHVQNYFGRLDLLAGITWSLAIEEHFYLILPLVLYLTLSVQRATSLVGTFLFLAIACGTLRGLAESPMPVVETHLRIDSLAFGVLLAFFYHHHRAAFDRVARHRLALIACGLVLVGVARYPRLLIGVWESIFVPISLYLGYGAILMAVMLMPMHWLRSWWGRSLVLMGMYSYSIYLWHINGAYALIHALSETPWAAAVPGWLRWPVGMAIYVLTATGVGVLMGRCVEMPALALRDRLFPRKSGPLAAAEPSARVEPASPQV